MHLWDLSLCLVGRSGSVHLSGLLGASFCLKEIEAEAMQLNTLDVPRQLQEVCREELEFLFGRHTATSGLTEEELDEPLSCAEALLRKKRRVSGSRPATEAASSSTGPSAATGAVSSSTRPSASTGAASSTTDAHDDVPSPAQVHAFLASAAQLPAHINADHEAPPRCLFRQYDKADELTGALQYQYWVGILPDHLTYEGHYSRSCRFGPTTARNTPEVSAKKAVLDYLKKAYAYWKWPAVV